MSVVKWEREEVLQHYSQPQTERVAGQRSVKGGEGEGRAGRVVKDKGVREGQHLDPELFPMRVTFV